MNRLIFPLGLLGRGHGFASLDGNLEKVDGLFVHGVRLQGLREALQRFERLSFNALGQIRLDLFHVLIKGGLVTEKVGERKQG